MSEQGTFVPVTIKQARPTGEPPRCVECGAVANMATFGPVRCWLCSARRCGVEGNRISVLVRRKGD